MLKRFASSVVTTETEPAERFSTTMPTHTWLRHRIGQRKEGPASPDLRRPLTRQSSKEHLS